MKLLLLLFLPLTCEAQLAAVDTIHTGKPSRIYLQEAAFVYDSVKVVYQYITNTGVITSAKGYEVVKRYLVQPGVAETVAVVARLDNKKKLIKAGRLASVPIRFDWK